jgi:tRNA(Ile)-lysidine synthase
VGAAASALCADYRRIGVAVSGGIDSTALWHASARLAQSQGSLEVVGLHVHHGLQPQANDWLQHLQRQARRWATRGLPVSLEWRRLDGSPGRGDSVEAWARRERYKALAEMAVAHGIDLVLLAHHRRDQAETFLLQALRGAGAAGLSAMPSRVERGGITWARPWLEHGREAVETYARRHRLGFVEDPSNGDTRLLRNRVRHLLAPVLSNAFEGSEQRLCASAARAQEAAACLRELAEIDLQGALVAGGQLQVAAWSRLSAPRRANLLRAWLSDFAPAGVPDSLVQRLQHELPHARVARWPFGNGELHLHRGKLGYVDAVAQGPAKPLCAGRIDLSQAGCTPVPQWQGSFRIDAVEQGGLPAALLRECELRVRSGGERFQRAAKSPPRSLKKQYQAAGLPAWERQGPLVFANDLLLYVPGLGFDARRVAEPGVPRVSLRWVPGAAPGA